MGVLNKIVQIGIVVVLIIVLMLSAFWFVKDNEVGFGTALAISSFALFGLISITLIIGGVENDWGFLCQSHQRKLEDCEKKINPNKESLEKLTKLSKELDEASQKLNAVSRNLNDVSNALAKNNRELPKPRLNRNMKVPPPLPRFSQRSEDKERVNYGW